jgi:hypothetical protein
VNAFSFLPEMGVSMEVFSGGQSTAAEGGPRTGSTRHDHGGAADVFFHQNGRRLDWGNPQDQAIFRQIVERGKAGGVTGFGAGPGYMQPGSMHVGFGAPGVWGAGGKGANAPEWLRAAYNGVPAGKMPAGGAAAPISAMYAGPTPVAPNAQPAGLPSLFAAPGMDPSAPLMPPGNQFGALASLFMQQQVRQDERRAEEQEAEQARRVALFGGGGIAGLYS